MDSEDKKLLKRNLKLSGENHEMLVRLQRNMRWSRGLRVLYWLVIIGGSFGAYYFIQPYIDILREGLGGVQTGMEGMTDGVGTGLDFLKGFFVK